MDVEGARRGATRSRSRASASNRSPRPCGTRAAVFGGDNDATRGRSPPETAVGSPVRQALRSSTFLANVLFFCSAPGSRPAIMSPAPMNICVVGTGYVGLVTGAVFADLGNDVVCVDNDDDKVAELLRAGQHADLRARPRGDGRPQRRATAGSPSPPTSPTRVRRSDVVFIAVGTPPKETRRDRPLDVEAWRREIGQHHGPLQGRGQQVHRAGGHRRVRARGHRAATSRGRSTFDVVSQSRVPARGLGHRGLARGPTAS